MRFSTHGVIALAGIAVAYGGFLFACPELSNEHGSKQRSKELAQIGKQVDQRIRLKSTITQNLIDGHTSLDGAVADFRALNQIEPEIESATHLIYRGETVEESTSLQVISYARVMTRNRAERRILLDRLEREFELSTGKKPVLLLIDH
jgi:hypothetical protein